MLNPFGRFITFVISNSIFTIVLILALLLLFCMIISKNPVNVILLLILFFFDIAVLFIFCSMDYIAVLFLLLYAGAISIVLLFVVMLLDMKDIVLRKEKLAKVLIGGFLAFSVFLSTKTLYVLYISIFYYFRRIHYFKWSEITTMTTNIKVIGLVLYEYYLFQFLIIGVFLFLIMVLIISLIINHNLLTKRQNLSEQLKKKDSITFSG